MVANMRIYVYPRLNLQLIVRPRKPYEGRRPTSDGRLLTADDLFMQLTEDLCMRHSVPDTFGAYDPILHQQLP